jgi:large subunit ribosomal protein L15
LVLEKVAVKADGKIRIDVGKLGYQKVLGTGKLTKPLIIEAKHFSKVAAKKLAEAGGEAVRP